MKTNKKKKEKKKKKRHEAVNITTYTHIYFRLIDETGRGYIHLMSETQLW